MSTDTTPGVAAHAAIPDAIALDSLTLIGIFSRPGGTSALLRVPSGDILTVTPGDQVAGVTVTALTAETLHLTDAAGQAHVLRIPG